MHKSQRQKNKEPPYCEKSMESAGNTEDSIAVSDSIGPASGEAETSLQDGNNAHIHSLAAKRGKLLTNSKYLDSTTPSNSAMLANQLIEEVLQLEDAQEREGDESSSSVSIDDEKERISRYHRKFLEAYREYWEKEGSHGDISAFASSLPGIEQSLDKSGDMERTLLHLIASRGFGEGFDGGKHLVRWLMEKYPDLYRAVDDLGWSILDTALKSRMRRDRESFIRLFIKKFPAQTAELVNLDEDARVLHALAPKLIQFDCPASFFQYLGDRAILSKDNEEGNTLLHVATQCEEGKGPTNIPQHQLDVVERIIEACPGALCVLNRKGQSVYQHRLHSIEPDKVPPRSSDDTISWFLKNKIMNLKDRDEIRQLLYGNSQGWKF